ncbi:MAG TPA: ABC transporter substrate-binding protein [Beijerinckiaceae bacterium]|jgi:putative ABC transport system substrate-binding protein
MRRREFIAALGGASAWPFAASAPFAAPADEAAPLVAVLGAASAASLSVQYEAFRGAMRELGYVEGRTIRYEYRFADGALDRLPTLAAELVALNPRVIVSAPLPANLAVRDATRTIPIVMATGADPVGFGLVDSLARPGRNVTGLTNFAEELASKQLDLLRALLPRLTRVAALVNVANPLHARQWQETQDAARKASITLIPFEIHNPDELELAFAVFAREGADALLVPPDVTFGAHRVRIAEMAAAARLPAIYFNRRAAEAGGLMSYSPDDSENYRRAATFVDRILKGARPADLPIEQPTRIELVINLKTARALGLEVPPTLLARADTVIE